ncbi:(Fe-S)-binding protein [Desulfolucanica intricata]|uniref:(Fe-S)-binding protein n=1 Tax=Desulfolucanica intricata TaxID=1285191 RepID=UPI000832820F|nr:(Fe-S)-binding protein [Desulfolucanica intricata]
MLSQLKQLEDVKDQFQKCVRCGLCRSVCPIFKEDRRETTAPRGKVFLTQMLSSGEIEPGSKVSDKLSMCLLCESCSSECPSGIEVHKLVILARSMVSEKCPSLTNQLIFKKIWTKPQLLNRCVGLLRAGQSFGLLNIGYKMGFLPKSSGLLGQLPGRPARYALPETFPAITKQRARVGYFLGCATNYMFPEVAYSTVKVLSYLGCEVVIPKNTNCCGLPQMANGELATGQQLAAHNLEIFSQAEVEALICDCASCSATLSHSRDGDLPVYDAVSYIMQQLQPDFENRRKINKAITYHDPCHLAKAQKITTQPRQLLQMLPGIEYREMPGAGDCCGGAGTFVIKNFDMSMRILDRKIANIKDTGAELVATCCPTCTMQLSYGLSRHGLNVEVAHPLELLAESLGL